ALDDVLAYRTLFRSDDTLRAKSAACFIGELRRCRALGIPWVVSHPGNYIDAPAAGLDRNARAYADCLTAVPGNVGGLIEGTAGRSAEHTSEPQSPDH